MKAVLMTAAGDPEVLQLQEVPDPMIQTYTRNFGASPCGRRQPD
jgi:hypothetical protein